MRITSTRAFGITIPTSKVTGLRLQAGMESSAAEFPQKTFELLRTLEDGDLVAVHGRVRLKPDTPWIALIHIFRFEGDLIIEEWEAAQQVPDNSPNENGAF